MSRARWRVARSDVLWWVASFLALQVGLSIALETWLPSWRDPNYAVREERLRAKVEQHPGRPVVVVLGSSRTMNGVCPAELMTENAPGNTTPLLVNWGFPGHGPVQLAMRLDRLIRDGFRPAGVVIEIVPALLPLQENADDPLPPRDHCWNDLPTAAGVRTSGDAVYGEWMNARLMPWFAHRHTIMNHYLPVWQSGAMRQDHWWKGLDSWGWLPVRAEGSHPEAVQFTKKYFERRLQQAEVDPQHEKAIRHVLSICKREKLPVAILLMPEGPAFQSWYAPEARARWDTFLGGLCQEYRVPLVDARGWLPSEDSFVDSHHLVPDGARAFTHRLTRETIPMLLRDVNAEMARAD